MFGGEYDKRRLEQAFLLQSCRNFSHRPICVIESIQQPALGVPSPSKYPRPFIFCATLMAWKFMPNTSGTPTRWDPVWSFPLISLRMASTLLSS